MELSVVFGTQSKIKKLFFLSLLSEIRIKIRTVSLFPYIKTWGNLVMHLRQMALIPPLLFVTICNVIPACSCEDFYT
jgi:hypothetical protein